MNSTSLLPYIQFIPKFLLGFVLSLALTPIVGEIARKFNIVDMPGPQREPTDPTRNRRIHTEPKLLLGGIAVVVPFVVLTLIYVPTTKYLWGLISGIIILLLCGILDDVFELKARVQAIFHFFAAFLVVASGLEINIISNPFGQVINLQFWQITIHGVIRFLPAAIITILWIFFIINAVKWVAGSDGLVEGNASIAALIIGLLSVRFQTNETAIMGFILSGCLLGFLVFNFYPSKIMSGSPGKSVYGFILAVLAIYAGGKLATFILTLSLPILDAIWVIFYRIKVNRPKTLGQLLSISDKNHIHHKLLDLGFNQKQVAIIEYLFTLLTGTLGFLLTGMYKAETIFATILILIIIYLVISHILKKRTLGYEGSAVTKMTDK